MLAGNREEARAIGDVHTKFYLRTENYRNNLIRLGWQHADMELPGSDALFDAIVAWGDVAAVHDRSRGLIDAGVDQVVLNLITGDRSIPYLHELRQLASLTESLG